MSGSKQLQFSNSTPVRGENLNVLGVSLLFVYGFFNACFCEWISKMWETHNKKKKKSCQSEQQTLKVRSSEMVTRTSAFQGQNSADVKGPRWLVKVEITWWVWTEQNRNTDTLLEVIHYVSQVTMKVFLLVCFSKHPVQGMYTRCKCCRLLDKRLRSV